MGSSELVAGGQEQTHRKTPADSHSWRPKLRGVVPFPILRTPSTGESEAFGQRHPRRRRTGESEAFGQRHPQRRRLAEAKGAHQHTPLRRVGAAVRFSTHPLRPKTRASTHPSGASARTRHIGFRGTIHKIRARHYLPRGGIMQGGRPCGPWQGSSEGARSRSARVQLYRAVPYASGSGTSTAYRMVWQWPSGGRVARPCVRGGRVARARALRATSEAAASAQAKCPRQA